MVIISLAGEVVMAEAEAINPILTERWRLELGAAFIDPDTKYCTQDDGGDRDCVDQDDLGADDDDYIFQTSLHWRFRERWRLNLGYIKFAWDGDTDVIPGVSASAIPPGEQGDVAVTSDFNADFYTITLGYSLIKKDNFDLTIGAGAHIIDFDTSITSVVSIPGGGQAAVDSEDEDITAPMPNVFISADYAFTPRLALRGNFQWLSLKVDDYEGDLFALSSKLDYRVADKLGIGIGYSYFDLDVTIDYSRREDKYELDSSGPLIYLSLGF